MEEKKGEGAIRIASEIGISLVSPSFPLPSLVLLFLFTTYSFRFSLLLF